MLKRYKRQRDYGFFDQDIRLNKLSKLGDPLEKLNEGIDFEIFRDLLEAKLAKAPQGKGGRRPYDYVLMFKILILQRYYNMSDHQVEYQINDRMSFMRFLNLTISDDIPDSKTVWHFREQLTDLGVIESAFELFLTQLERLELVVKEGQIIDASFVEVPKQRNSRGDNALIKEGSVPTSIEENKHKKSQKDLDARWTKKNNVSYYGYKNHAKVDSGSKIITKYVVTDASVHDSQALESLLDETDRGQILYADSAYTGEKQEQTLVLKEVTGMICEKGYKGKPLTEEQKENNRLKSKTRSRVEHIFGFMEGSMNGMYLYAVGQKRVTAIIGLMNLTYNMFRKIQLQPTIAGQVCLMAKQ
jgi:transposase, IS5 family